MSCRNRCLTKVPRGNRDSTVSSTAGADASEKSSNRKSAEQSAGTRMSAKSMPPVVSYFVRLKGYPSCNWPRRDIYMYTLRTTRPSRFPSSRPHSPRSCVPVARWATAPRIPDQPFPYYLFSLDARSIQRSCSTLARRQPALSHMAPAMLPRTKGTGSTPHEFASSQRPEPPPQKPCLLRRRHVTSSKV